VDFIEWVNAMTGPPNRPSAISVTRGSELDG
jgi:hypothetical protein